MFDGKIFAVFIYPRILTIDEIIIKFTNLRKSRDSPSPSSLISRTAEFFGYTLDTRKCVT